MTWAEIDLSAIACNVRLLKALIGDACRLMAVVKADGYGHGMCRVAETALANGASMLGVARAEEGLCLRENGVRSPILVMGYTPVERIPEMAFNNLTLTVWSEDQARLISEAALRTEAVIPVHYKVDTGMGRLGESFSDEDVSSGLAETVGRIVAVSGLPGISLAGIYTHFASADDEDKTHTLAQLARFLQLTKAVKVAGLSHLIRHAANSAAVIDLPETCLDMVRTGVAVYGLCPSPAMNCRRISLHPAMTWKTRIVQRKQVPAGATVSYGSTYTTPKPTTLAVVPVGYADGYNRALSSRGQMLVSGKRVPVVGRVCMDLTILDLDGVDDVAVGDEVVVLGQQGRARITADEIAAWLNTINYEVVTGVSRRVPRVYV